MKALAPGKLILSGEHAIVYKKPAIAIAIDHHVQTSISASKNQCVRFSLLGTQSKLTFPELHALKESIDKQYRSYLDEKCHVGAILDKPENLAHYVIAHVLHQYNLHPEQGFNVHINSTILPGCGMGSSAATILSVLLAAQDYFKVAMPPDGWLHTGTLIENLQHGRSSGFDIRVSLQGGCLYKEGDTVTAKALPKMPFYCINTGKPESTTGECVTQVAKHFSNHPIWHDFDTVTKSMNTAITENNVSTLQACIQKNHALLTTLGVVPKPIQQFIAKLEKQNAAAKICGAGSIQGNHAGVLLIVSENPKNLTSLCEQYGYTLERIKGTKQGAHLV